VDSLVTLLDEAKTRNFERWPVLGQYVWPNPFVGNTYQEEINYLKNWIVNRITWLDQNMIGEPTNVDETNNQTPNDFLLEQNYPNPFNPTTKIKYTIPNVTLSMSSRAESRDEESFVTLKVFDILGKEVATLVNEYKEAGNYEIEFNVAQGSLPEITSGVYFYQLRAGDYVETKKMVLRR